MSRPFSLSRPASAGGAAAELARPGALPLGGGTDLLVLLDEGLVGAERLVDLRSIPDSRRIVRRQDGSLFIGGQTRLDDIAGDETIRREFPVLAQAAEGVGTPALRQMGTIGGNLCQRPRCWYFRRGVHCHKNGGDHCPAVEGENQYLAILEGGPCWIVHPSDPAVALAALDAVIEITGPGGTRSVTTDELFVLPSVRMDRETALGEGEFVSGVVLPASSAGPVQRYEKLMQRGAWDFALASAAAVRRGDGAVRIVLGGVAPRPWRVPSSIEEDVASGGLDADTVEILAERALHDAAPLSRNGYKVDLAATLLRRAIAAVME